MAPAHRKHIQTNASLAKHYDGFLKSLRMKRPETRATYGRALREFLRWYPPGGKIRMVRADVERYKLHLSAEKNLSAVSVSTYLTSLRRFCSYLVRCGVLKENPAQEVSGNSRPRTHSRAALTSGEAASLISRIDHADERGLRDHAFIRLMLECALSEIEIIRADIGDRVRREGETLLRVQGKGRIRKDQVVALPASVASALDEYLALRAPTSPEEPLFTSAGNRTRGQRMTTRGVRDRVNLYLKRAGLRDLAGRHVTPFSLRHTAAVLMADAGASADEIRERMRLGSNETAKVYIKQSHEQASDQ